MNVLIEVLCRGCEQPFFVHPDQNANHPNAYMCRMCQDFQGFMELLHQEPPKVEPGVWKGLKWGLIVVGPIWIGICFWLFMR